MGSPESNRGGDHPPSRIDTQRAQSFIERILTNPDLRALQTWYNGHNNEGLAREISDCCTLLQLKTIHDRLETETTNLSRADRAHLSRLIKVAAVAIVDKCTPSETPAVKNDPLHRQATETQLHFLRDLWQEVQDASQMIDKHRLIRLGATTSRLTINQLLQEKMRAYITNNNLINIHAVMRNLGNSKFTLLFIQMIYRYKRTEIMRGNKQFKDTWVSLKAMKTQAKKELSLGCCWRFFIR
jgi:hypothetical protein